MVVGDGTASRSGSPIFASDTVSEALAEAPKASDIQAIILRIDSPGGSPLAADQIWRAARQARAQGKPVIVSCSDLAASAAYYAAAGADAIVAQPASLTGSIGVFVLRPVLRGLLEKLDIGVESLTRGGYASLLLASEPLTESTRAWLHAEVVSIYDLFLSRVSEGRDLTLEQVDRVARGRVWTGEQAAGKGLVDEIGGLRVAVRRALTAARARSGSGRGAGAVSGAGLARRAARRDAAQPHAPEPTRWAACCAAPSPGSRRCGRERRRCCRRSFPSSAEIGPGGRRCTWRSSST